MGTDVTFNLSKYMRNRGQKVDQALDKYLPSSKTKPATIHQAMRYSLFAGGKRIRPILTIAAAEACGGSFSHAKPLACAVECIHTYSLIHDDLPAMDDDEQIHKIVSSAKPGGYRLQDLVRGLVLSDLFKKR